MGSNRYSLAVGRMLERDVEGTSRTPHYHILLDCNGLLVRIAVNTSPVVRIATAKIAMRKYLFGP